MLLNTWLSVARRSLFSNAGRRGTHSRTQRITTLEQLEQRTLLSVNALVINSDNYDLYTNPAGGLEVDNSDMAGYDGLVLEGFSVSPTSGDAISINLSGLLVHRLAIESVTIPDFATVGMDIDLSNVSGLESVAIENITVSGTGRALDLTFSNTDTASLTIEDSTLPGISISALAGSNIGNGIVTENVINAGEGFEGVLLNVQSSPGLVSTANNFRIVNNTRINTLDRDAVRINATAGLDATNSSITELRGLTIQNNPIGSSEGADVLFRAEGDTFVQPFRLTNRAVRGELLQTFVFDLSDIGLAFDADATTGKPFTPLNGSGAATGVSTAVLSNNNQTLTVTFTDFNPGETLEFVLDIDLADGTPASIFGNNLIGADVAFLFLGNKNVSGQMAGDPVASSAAQFLPGAGTAGVTHGIYIDADGSPISEVSIVGNSITGVPGHGILFDSTHQSDVTGEVRGNTIASSGIDGIRVSMTDSRFAGGIVQNTIANNGGDGISLLPTASFSGGIETVTGGRVGQKFVITSTNHGLVDGDVVIIQGIQEGNQGVNHGANGQFVVQRISNNKFALQGTDINFGRIFVFAGGGSWYVPDFRGGGSGQNNARGFAQIDLQVDGASQAISGASNTTDIRITSAAHGLRTGDQIRITGVQGNTAANGTFPVTVLSANQFLLRGISGNGDYTIGGSFVRLEEAASNGDVVFQGINGNSITGNFGGGIYARPEVGSTVRADITQNVISQNQSHGIQFESHSFGLGTDLPLPPGNSGATVEPWDLGFNVIIGTESPGQGNITGGGNTLHQNVGTAIALEGLDYGTGSFEVWNNTISATKDDKSPSTPYTGDGIFIRLDDGRINADASALLQTSVIRNNVIGVDNLGNEGNGLFFSMKERARIQDLEVINNTFLNSGRDGFHFERSEDAYLNSVRFEKNKSTNNVEDGFDIFARNTTLDQLDFFINDNFIEDNGQYGLRLDAQADARLDVEFNSNSVRRNGHTPAGAGFHPDDGVPGSAKSAGGVGIHAFQQIDITFRSIDSTISENFGDGFSIDAFNYFDTLKFHGTFERVTLDENTLTGFRNHGAAFGSFSFVDSSFQNNGEDGMRIVSIEDKDDVYRRRVGGMDLDLSVLNSDFSFNGQDGVHLGQGVSADFGDGTVENSIDFSFNGRDGLKITQHNSAYLDDLLFQGNERRRQISVSNATFTNNGSDGVDIGHDVSQETGNSQHGDERASDVYVTIDEALIIQNAGDGIEYQGDDRFEIPRLPGGGQDVPAQYNSSLEITNSRVSNNAGRGIDILNRQQEDTFVLIRNNDVLSNGLEGIYVMNTASPDQLQTGSDDPLAVDLTGSNVPNPNIELRVQDNLIQSNGTADAVSRVTTWFEFGQNDASGVASKDWGPGETLIPGTLGGLVIRVGNADSVGFIPTALTELELGQSGVDAEIWSNHFDGNYGAEVYFDSFVSQMPAQSGVNFDVNDTPDFVAGLIRDPLSRFDLSFRYMPGISAVSPPISAHPLASHPAAIPLMTAAAVSTSNLPQAK